MQGERGASSEIESVNTSQESKGIISTVLLISTHHGSDQKLYHILHCTIIILCELIILFKLFFSK